jgi:hypothetical protein
MGKAFKDGRGGGFEASRFQSFNVVREELLTAKVAKGREGRKGILWPEPSVLAGDL